MGQVHDVKPEDVVNPRVLEVVIPDTVVEAGAGRDRQVANRLFIFTGTMTGDDVFGVAMNNGVLIRWTAKLDLSRLPGHPIFDDNPFRFITVNDPVDPTRRILKGTTTATPATIGWYDNSDRSIWGVDAADVIEENDHLILLADCALQGELSGIGRVSYQVNLLAQSL